MPPIYTYAKGSKLREKTKNLFKFSLRYKIIDQRTMKVDLINFNKSLLLQTQADSILQAPHRFIKRPNVFLIFYPQCRL